MTAAKHTRGPWELQHGALITAKNGLHIALAANSGMNASEANARLIAAAPELLEALERALRHIPVHAEADMWAARAAVAKATRGDA
jgi:hypothetical protein